jgi:hypothetical protein
MRIGCNLLVRSLKQKQRAKFQQYSTLDYLKKKRRQKLESMGQLLLFPGPSAPAEASPPEGAAPCPYHFCGRWSWVG